MRGLMAFRHKVGDGVKPWSRSNVHGTIQEYASLEAQLQAALNVIPAHAWYASPSGGLAFVNERTAEYFGIAKDHPLRLGIDAHGEWDSHIPLLHPDDHEKTRRVWSTCIRTGCADQVSFRVRKGEGGYRWFLSRAEPLRASDGSLLYWIGINLEIDEPKRAEFCLAEEEQFPLMGSWVFNPAGFFSYWSRELFHIYGLDPAKEAPSLDQYLSCVHTQDREFMRSLIRNMVADALGCDVTKLIVRPDGELRHVRWVGAPVVEDGKLQRIIGAAIDVTKHELLTQEFRRREACLDEAQRRSRTGSFGWNPGTGEIIWSDETYRIFEYERGSKPTLDMVVQRIHPEDRVNVKEFIDRVSRGATDFEHAYRLLLPNGRVKHIQSIARALQDASGNYEFVGAVTDVTEHEHVEEKIREREAEIRQVLNFTPQLVAVFGPNRERLFANCMALDYLGMSLDQWREGVLGSDVHRDDVEQFKAHWDQAASSGSAYELELRLRKSNGSFRWFLARFNPVHDDRGRILSWYVACNDIDDRKREEERLQQENTALREEINQVPMFEDIVGSSLPLQRLLAQVSKVAPSDSTVLVLGETGTGKELIARAIHKRSKRAARAFIGVNCGAIPASLIASELFGYEKGAFTGAIQRRIGRFEAANGGTIFLDEIGDLPSDVQITLLRILQEREIERIGNDKPIPVDVRVITATHRDLDKLVSEGKFRQDLLYRLNVVPLEVPSLRERAADISLLVEYFIARFGKKVGKKFISIDKRTLEVLQTYRWPGNIRELQNLIERAVILSDSNTFAVDEAWLKREPSEVTHSNAALNGVLLTHEKEAIEAALAQCHGRVSGPAGAAAKLGVPDSTLDAKIKRLGINKHGFKSPMD
jgi:PAS domain S-box-containing protein